MTTVLAIFAMLTPVSALASTTHGTVAAPAADRAALLKAFGDPPAATPCLATVLAAANHDYGSVRLRSARSCRRWGFNGVNVFRRGAHGRWKDAFEGSSYSCPVARIPVAVQRQLSICH